MVNKDFRSIIKSVYWFLEDSIQVKIETRQKVEFLAWQKTKKKMKLFFYNHWEKEKKAKISILIVQKVSSEDS